MIGQVHLMDNIFTTISNESLSHFILLSGERGSGRKLVASLIAQKLNGHTLECGIKVDEVRDMISLVNKTADNIIVVIADVDNMSISAKNALLKITEEPPKNVRFIMTIEDESTVPDTILSRATVFRMDKYSPQELIDFAESYSSNLTPEELDIIGDVCDTPGDVKTLIDIGVIEFYEYVTKVVEHIDTVSTANSFKIAKQIALKPDADGYELKLFWRTFNAVCIEYAGSKTDIKYVKWVRITSDYRQMLKVRGVNLQMLFDMWVSNIRGE